MSEMIERVARAMAKRHYENRFGRSNPSHIQMNVDGNWQIFMDDVRATIEAMREPTKEMEIAGSIDPGSGGPNSGYEVEVWQAMIDAALTSPSTSALPESDGMKSHSSTPKLSP